MVVPGLPHHVTQRGNRREAIFFEGGDQQICDMLAEQLRKSDVEVWACWLMPSHVQVPSRFHSWSSRERNRPSSSC
jgi:putative transposase